MEENIENQKAILALSGLPEGKVRFDQVAKNEDKTANDGATWWLWNISPKNVAGKIAKMVGWNGERDENYEQFVTNFIALANKHFGFEDWYLDTKVEALKENPKAELLVLHGFSRETVQRMQEEYNGVTIHVQDGAKPPSTAFDKSIIYDADFEKNVFEILNVLTKKYPVEEKE